MRMPNFIIIGAQKAGTTSLADQMSGHPQIYLSPIKEPGFFDFEGTPPNFHGPRDAYLYENVVTDLKSYQKLYDNVSDEVAIGEATTWYLYSRRAPELIYNHIPEVKLIAILRNPIDRAYSAYMHARRDDRENLVSFCEALDMEEERISKGWEYLWRYKQMGLYHVQLSRYFALFPKKNIRIYLYDDLIENVDFLVEDICDFLQVNPSLMPYAKRLNVSGIPRLKFVHKILSGPNLIRKAVKPLVPSVKMREKIRLKVIDSNMNKPRMTTLEREKLKSFFEDDILKLEKLIYRDLSRWLA